MFGLQLPWRPIFYFLSPAGPSSNSFPRGPASLPHALWSFSLRAGPSGQTPLPPPCGPSRQLYLLPHVQTNQTPLSRTRDYGGSLARTPSTAPPSQQVSVSPNAASSFFFSQQHVETATDSTESAGELLLYGKSGSTNRTTEIWGRLHPVFFPVEHTSSRILTKSDSMPRVSGFATNPVVICPWPWLFKQELWINRWQEKGQSELAPCILKRSNTLQFAIPASPHLGPRHVATHGCRDDPGVWPWFKVTGRRRRPGVEPCRVWCLFSCLRHIWPAVVP